MNLDYGKSKDTDDAGSTAGHNTERGGWGCFDDSSARPRTDGGTAARPLQPADQPVRRLRPRSWTRTTPAPRERNRREQVQISSNVGGSNRFLWLPVEKVRSHTASPETGGTPAWGASRADAGDGHFLGRGSMPLTLVTGSSGASLPGFRGTPAGGPASPGWPQGPQLPLDLLEGGRSPALQTSPADIETEGQPGQRAERPAAICVPRRYRDAPGRTAGYAAARR